MLHLRHLLDFLFQLRQYLGGAEERSARLGIDAHHDRTRIFIGHKSGLGSAHQHHHQRHRSHQQSPCHHPMAAEVDDTPNVPLHQDLESRIERLAEA